MKKTEIKRPQHTDGKGLIGKLEYLRVLHNVSKSELTKGICSVAMYNRYLQGDAVIGIDRLEKLASYFGYSVILSL